MSLSRFHSETDELLRTGEAPTLERASELVRDRWLAARQYYALVAAILGNWTSGNCVSFMLPVSRALLASGDLDLHHHLWARSIKRQINKFFREYAHLRGQGLTFDEIIATESSGFDEFNCASYTDKLAASSFLLNRLMSDLGLWKKELESYRVSTTQVDQVVEGLKALKKPSIELVRLAPNNSIKPKPPCGSA